MNKIKTLVALAGLALSGAAFAVSGTYISNAVCPTIYAPNYLYDTNFSITQSLPSNAIITQVQYSYTVGSIPSGGTFQAYLCRGNTSECIDVKNNRSGTTLEFNGESATVPYFLTYRINRSSSFAPVSGGTCYLYVSWTN